MIRITDSSFSPGTRTDVVNDIDDEKSRIAQKHT